MKPSLTFGKVRSVLWPVYRHEAKTVVPMLLLFFFLTLAYDLLRPLKVSMVVQGSSAGFEVIPFLKVWVMLPGAVALTWVYTKLAARMSMEKVFYAILSIFCLFYMCFLTFLYPNRELLALDGLASWLTQILPIGARGLIAVVRDWPLSIFYAITELWGALVLTVLMWGYANEVTDVEHAQRFYGLFAMGSNIAAVVAGYIGATFSTVDYNPYLPGNNAWEQTIHYIIATGMLACIFSAVLFRYINVYVYPDKVVAAPKSKKKKLGLVDCFKQVSASPYLLLLAALVLGYNLSFNLADIVWNREVHRYFSNDPAGFNKFMSHVTSATGVISTIMALLVTSNLLRLKGWTVTALMTPVVVFFTGGIFFALLLVDNSNIFGVNEMIFGIPIATVLLAVGAVQMCFTRALKYTVFDATKEIAYIPLSREERQNGKAAIDGIGSRLGKSGGSLLFQLLLVSLSSFDAVLPFIGVVFMFVVSLWGGAVIRLGRLIPGSATPSHKS
ncbi:MAG: Npt1/Npt2 family nucleotide transporter [Oligoflexales bacterium]